MVNLPTNMSRRDFLKQKFFFILYSYLSQFFNLIPTRTLTSGSKNDYAILDKLLEIPFSPIVKKEVYFRVGLQKKYCLDANGLLYPLDRFLREIVHFIIYHKNENDFDLLYNMQEKQIDYTYLLKTTIKFDEVNSMKKMQRKLLSLDDMLNILLYEAVKSKSFKCTTYLLQLNFNLQNSTQNAISSLISKKENESFNTSLVKTMRANIPPKSLNYHKCEKRTVRKKYIEEYFCTHEEYTENLFAIVYNSVCDLYLNYFIDDYSVYLADKKVYVTVWNYQKVYNRDFFKIFESIILENGFKSFSEGIIEDGTLFKFGYTHSNIDNYNFINLDVL